MASTQLSTSELQRELAAASPEQMPGRRKAAVLIAALGPELSAQVITHLKEEEIEVLSLEMTRLDSVGKPMTDTVMAELAAVVGGQQGVYGGVAVAREVLERALGSERTDQLLGRIFQSGEARPFEFLHSTPPDQIAGVLRDESTQTIALVLANLQSSLAAQVLAKLPESMRPDVALCIACMGEPSTEILQQLEELMRQKRNTTVQQEYAGEGGVSALAKILGHSDRSVEHAVLGHLDEHDKELAEEVRSRIFLFEDVVKLDDRAIQQVLREADQKDLVLALRGAEKAVTESVLRNMSERGAQMLKEEMEIQQPQLRANVYAAQGRIVAVVRRLQQAGTIVIAGDGDNPEEELV